MARFLTELSEFESSCQASLMMVARIHNLSLMDFM